MLRSTGANLIDCVALNDHQRFSGQILKRLEHKALTAHAQLVNYEKGCRKATKRVSQKSTLITRKN